ncbi:MAG: ammonium transporter [Dehalococcoidia bacterium]|nr:ammonium transporter [Dehalococcoidia bacterium]
MRALSVGAALGAGISLVAGIGVASAQTPDEAIADLTSAIDTGWLLITATLVLFMQAGFAMVEAGFVRTKNVTNILMKNVLDACLGAIVYMAVGWAFAYGVNADGEAGGFIGMGNFFLNDFSDYASWFFQFAFAATAATIVSGAMAERTKFSAYLVYTVLITGFVYPIVTHWIWDGNGWLTAFSDDPMNGVGMVDFAGSTVVHSVGGWAALCGAIIVGARKGRFTDGKVTAFPGHSLPLGVLGVFILWVGWYGFNPGSTLGLSGGFYNDAARVAVTTTLAAGAGGATAMVVSWLQHGKSDLSLTLNGLLGGLVAITAGTATIEPIWAIVTGAIAGIIIVYGVMLLDALKIDDPVGAVPVHLMNGAWGTLAVGLFSSQALMGSVYGVDSTYGILFGGGSDLFITQIVGIVAVGAWTVVTSSIIFLAIKFTIGIRVSDAEEDAGLDVYEHGMEAYPEFTGGRDPFATLSEQAR